jgi:hypothetical protein
MNLHFDILGFHNFLLPVFLSNQHLLFMHGIRVPKICDPFVVLLEVKSLLLTAGTRKNYGWRKTFGW